MRDEYLESLIGKTGKEFGIVKGREYIDDPSEAPDDAEVQEGPRGGLYFETTGGSDESGGSGSSGGSAPSDASSGGGSGGVTEEDVVDTVHDIAEVDGAANIAAHETEDGYSISFDIPDKDAASEVAHQVAEIDGTANINATETEDGGAEVTLDVMEESSGDESGGSGGGGEAGEAPTVTADELDDVTIDSLAENVGYNAQEYGYDPQSVARHFRQRIDRGEDIAEAYSAVTEGTSPETVREQLSEGGFDIYDVGDEGDEGNGNGGDNESGGLDMDITELEQDDEVVADIGQGPEELHVQRGAKPEFDLMSVVAEDPVSQERYTLEPEDILGTDPADVEGARDDGRPPDRFE